MEFEYEKQDNVGVLSLSGSLIGENDGMRLTDEVSEHIEDGTNLFLVDLTNLKHINSSGLGVLITLLTKARKKDGEMVLVNPSDYIKNLMVITKLNTIFNVFDSQEEGIKELKKVKQS